MKKPTILIYACMIFILSIGLVNENSLAWSGPNYYNHWESGLGIGLYHNGEVQVQPSHIDNGYHYAQGMMFFDNGAEGYKAVYTTIGSSKNDGSLLYKYYKYRDRWTLEPVPPVTFEVGAVMVPTNASYWPI